MNKKLKKFEEKLEILYENKWQQAPFTIVVILGRYKGNIYAGIGATEFSDKDLWDDQRGFEIARGRAISHMRDSAKRAKRYGLCAKDMETGSQMIPHTLTE